MKSDESKNGAAHFAGKVAAVTFAFWVIKICATTLGEAGGDALSMTFKLGYETSSWIFFAFFVVTAALQIGAKKYQPFLYWLAVVGTTLVGTTVADMMSRSFKLGYPQASLILLGAVFACLAAWRLATGSVSISSITSKKAEVFYWVTIMVSNTLGTALGDWVSDDERIGFLGGAGIFAGSILVVAALMWVKQIPRAFLFWAAFILTRPLGATLGDLLTKPRADGGLDLSRPACALVIAVAMVPLIWFFSRKPEEAAA